MAATHRRAVAYERTMAIMSDTLALRDDFRQHCIVDTTTMPWEASPSPGVWRKRLELSGPREAGRVTSVVRYDPGSKFPPHPHPDGEEILVLDGVFSDETGDFGPGSYLLNPEGFFHAPRSADGCILFVKLRQYGGSGRVTARERSETEGWRPHALPGIAVRPLYASERHPERMHLLRFEAETATPLVHMTQGEEIFVIAGDFADDYGEYTAGTWIRFPPGSRHRARSTSGCLLYVKQHHLGPSS